EALQAAHVRGVVHRDIKPDNVMLEREGASARVVLTDFGVAQVTGMETMTATGALVGSPSYMTPEQGRGEDVGPASDLFSLGVLLYEMATGVLPFPGRDPLTVLAAIGKGLFKRPSAVSRFAGVGLDEICARCLCVNAAERYADAAALAADLRRYCAEAGLADGAAALRAFLTDPDSFETGLRPRVADAAVATARRHARRGELARALGHLARATAYVPGHAEAEKLIARISSRRAWAKVAAVASGVAIVGFGTWALSPWVRAKLAETGGERAAEQSESVAVAPGNAQGAGATVAREEPRRESDTTAVGAVEAVGTGDNDKARQGKPERNGRTIPLGSASDVSKKSTTSGSTLARDRVGGPAPTRTVAGTMRTGRGATTSPRAKAEESGAGETPGAVAGAGPATTGGTMPAEAIGAPAAEGTNEGAKPEISEGLRPGANDVSPPPATPPEPAVAEGSNANAASPTSAAWIPLHIFVENAFCTPSVDKQKPRRTPARYLVAAGAHQIHCEMPGGHRW
ncbi:MAG TPA: protein kinase, partial [Polyangia bacterium]